MNKRTRYSLIIFGFIFFLIAAPLIMLFVSGVKYDFGEKRFVPTGILLVKTEPSEATIRLNGEIIKSSSGEIRFLLPKSYQINISKQGFFDWNKTVKIQSGQVTRANPQYDKIFLLRKDPNPSLISPSIKNFVSWQGGILAILEKELLIFEDWKFSSSKRLALPVQVSNILPSPDFKHFLLTQEASSSQPAQILLFNWQTSEIRDLQPLYKDLKQLPHFSFSENGRLFAHEDSAIYEINARDYSKQLLLSGITSIAVSGQSIYFISKTTQQSELASLDLSTGVAQTLAGNLPNFSNAQLFVNSRKKISLEADGALYDISTSGLILIANNLEKAVMQKPGEPLVYIASNELRYFDEQDLSQIATRLSEKITLPRMLKSLGYITFIKHGKLTALELDHSGPQNLYEIYSGQNIYKYEPDGENKNLLILDNGELKLLKIR